MGLLNWLFGNRPRRQATLPERPGSLSSEPAAAQAATRNTTRTAALPFKEPGAARNDQLGQPLANLLAQAQNDEPFERLAAMIELAKLSHTDERALSCLLRGLEDPNELVSGKAAEFLGDHQKDAARVLPALLRAYRRENHVFTDVNIEIAIGKLADVATILPLLDDGDVGWVRKVVGCLARMSEKPDIAVAIPSLEKLLYQDKESETVAFALGEIGGARALQCLTSALESSETEVRRRAAFGLWRLFLSHGVAGMEGAAVSACAERLARLGAEDSDVDVRWQSSEALTGIEPLPSTIVPWLTRMLQERESVQMRRRAAALLARLGQAASAAIPALNELMTGVPHTEEEGNPSFPACWAVVNHDVTQEVMRHRKLERPYGTAATSWVGQGEPTGSWELSAVSQCPACHSPLEYQLELDSLGNRYLDAKNGWGPIEWKQTRNCGSCNKCSLEMVAHFITTDKRLSMKTEPTLYVFVKLYSFVPGIGMIHPLRIEITAISERQAQRQELPQCEKTVRGLEFREPTDPLSHPRAERGSLLVSDATKKEREYGESEEENSGRCPRCGADLMYSSNSGPYVRDDCECGWINYELREQRERAQQEAERVRQEQQEQARQEAERVTEEHRERVRQELERTRQELKQKY